MKCYQVLILFLLVSMMTACASTKYSTPEEEPELTEADMMPVASGPPDYVYDQRSIIRPLVTRAR